MPYVCATVLVMIGLVVAQVMSPATVTAQPQPVDPIGEWSATASRLAAATGMAPLRTPITLAILHLAMRDATLAATSARRGPASGEGGRHPAVSPLAAAVEAGRQVLLAELPAAAAAVDARAEELFALDADARGRARGVEVGAAIARDWLRRRTGDRRNATVAYVPAAEPGNWVPTPPAFLPENTAFLARVTPFVLESPSRLRPGGPPRLRSRRWADDYNEVKRLGAKASADRTSEQTATALFWEPLAGTVWPATIRRLAREQQLPLAESATFQAAAFTAFADALIACWDAKYHYDFWRPVTAIRAGESDGNDATDADAAWEPLAVTPNFPEYASGHTCATAAVALTIESYFAQSGTGHESPGGGPGHALPLIPTRNVVSGEERFYASAEAVIDEVIEARLWLGVHFRSANEDGADIGRRVASSVRRRLLR